MVYKAKLGAWLKINGEAIYGTSPWLNNLVKKDSLSPHVWYTSKQKDALEIVIKIYGILLQWPRDNILRIKTTYQYVLAKSV